RRPRACRGRHNASYRHRRLVHGSPGRRVRSPLWRPGSAATLATAAAGPAVSRFHRVAGGVARERNGRRAATGVGGAAGGQEIAVGSPVSDRTRCEFEGLIGYFVNAVVMRCDLSGDPSFVALLGGVRDFAWNALARQELPFEDVIAAVGAERDGTGNPLFE